MTIDIDELVDELSMYLSHEPRKDPGFRHAIVTSQIGSLVAHFTHDAAENPLARPYGTRDGEVSDFGHALLQLMIYGISRHISPQEAIDAALIALREKDWQTRKAAGTCLKGVVAYPGKAAGKAYVDPFLEHPMAMPYNSILIAVHPKATGITQYIRRCAGIITDQGGMGCHAAIVAREFHVPCVVGTGAATSWIKTGDLVEIRGDEVCLL